MVMYHSASSKWQECISMFSSSNLGCLPEERVYNLLVFRNICAQITFLADRLCAIAPFVLSVIDKLLFYVIVLKLGS